MFKRRNFACLTKEFFHVKAISYIAMLKKIFQLVFRKVMNFSLVFFRGQIKSVCLSGCQGTYMGCESCLQI